MQNIHWWRISVALIIGSFMKNLSEDIHFTMHDSVEIISDPAIAMLTHLLGNKCTSDDQIGVCEQVFKLWESV